MKKNLGSLLRLLTAIIIFMISMIFIVLILDLLALPILNELLLEPYYRNWCGMLSQCTNHSKFTFYEYVVSMQLWEKINLEYLKLRLLKATFLGFIIGIFYCVVFFNKNSQIDPREG